MFRQYTTVLEIMAQGQHGDLLQVSPPDLKFRFELRKTIPVTLSLTNPTNDRVAFKVKTTSPKKYCVRPSSGFVEPNSSKDVQVIMQAQREYPPSLTDCKDKFLVQSVRMSADVKDVSPEAFDATKNKDIRQTKLRVILVGPPKPPSPVPEGVEEEPSPVKKDVVAPTREPVVQFAQDRNRLAEQGAKVEKDKAEVKRKLDEPVRSKQHSVAEAKPSTITHGGFNTIHLLIIALLAFLVGYLARR